MSALRSVPPLPDLEVPVASRAKHLPLRPVPQAALEPRRPELSLRKKAARHDAAEIVRDCAKRWAMTRRDFADTSEVSQKTIDDALTEDRPLPLEWLVMLDDAHGIQFANALKAFFEERRRIRLLNHR